MPKINVYVSDELAEAIKESGVPVSTVCQRALETAVRRVTAIREATLSPANGFEDRPNRLTRFTDRARMSVKLAVQHARDRSAAEVGTEDLLAGILQEGGNLAITVLQAMEIESAQIRQEIDRLAADAPPPAADDSNEGDLRFSSQAAAALELAVTEATSFGHNYVGCEHLLLGIISEPDGAGGSILRGLGADLRLTRRAVTTAMAGYVYMQTQLKQNTTTTTALADPMNKLAEMIDQKIQPLVQRLDRIEGGTTF
jgi:ATP-dependent Clp protease ATP-binding subunit ClpA